MGANKLALTAAAVSMLLSMATPVLAGYGHRGRNSVRLATTENYGGGYHYW
jgi:hypothetical protein